MVERQWQSECHTALGPNLRESRELREVEPAPVPDRPDEVARLGKISTDGACYRSP
jgi:hypothetical protein